ncbi:hypothetical protein OG747_22110 [Streptomyces sp. NBC_01384]|uniref:hypothetical protein n=1 Tax=Streptomyces sp. NBC_01384 TaxID=2903847 RepID=UPI0032506E1A
MKRIFGIIVAAFIMLGGGLVLAPSAFAGGYGCSGNQIDTYPVTYSGETFGNVYLYYDSSTGKNCAVTVSNSSHGYGSSKYMYVRVEKCQQTAPSGGYCTIYSPEVWDDNGGDFLYYAGPVTVSAAGHCISVVGEISWQGHLGDVQAVGHCG